MDFSLTIETIRTMVSLLEVKHYKDHLFLDKLKESKAIEDLIF